MDTSTMCLEYQPFSLLSQPRNERNLAPLRLPNTLPDEWLHMVKMPIEMVKAQEEALKKAMIEADQQARTSDANPVNPVALFLIAAIALFSL